MVISQPSGHRTPAEGQAGHNQQWRPPTGRADHTRGGWRKVAETQEDWEGKHVLSRAIMRAQDGSPQRKLTIHGKDKKNTALQTSWKEEWSKQSCGQEPQTLGWGLSLAEVI